MSAATEYCDREIAKCQYMIRGWPESEWRFNRLIIGWERIKKQLQQDSK